MFQSLWKFVCYWYFRYLMVTELYMVERWERAVIISLMLLIIVIIYGLKNWRFWLSSTIILRDVAMLLVFLMLSYFNCAVLLNATSSLIKYTLV